MCLVLVSLHGQACPPAVSHAGVVPMLPSLTPEACREISSPCLADTTNHEKEAGDGRLFDSFSPSPSRGMEIVPCLEQLCATASPQISLIRTLVVPRIVCLWPSLGNAQIWPRSTRGRINDSNVLREMAQKEDDMRVLYERCCGLDIHKASVAACALVSEKGKTKDETRRFGTMRADLVELAGWLQQKGIRHVAMESTGVYWKPVWNILEPAGFELLLANAQDVKIVPGRKTDQKDCQWIADLHQHGLLRNSFVPPRPIRDLRDLTRTRAILTQEHTSTCNRIQKVLEDANIKLRSVASDVFGASGRAILQALMKEEKDAEALADLAKGVLRNKIPQLRRALEGQVTAHHRLLITGHWKQMEFLEHQIADLETRIAGRMKPTPEEMVATTQNVSDSAPAALSPREEAILLWMEIPGVGWISACNMVAELGVNMDQFPSAAHVASWAAWCPGNNESAGKRFSGKTRKGNVWLRRTMCEVAWAASHTKGTYFAAQFRRLAARRGQKRALMAVAHSILVTAYHMLKHKRHYHELGADFFDVLNRDKVRDRLVERLAKLGFDVILKSKETVESASGQSR
jgi:transposase